MLRVGLLAREAGRDRLVAVGTRRDNQETDRTGDNALVLVELEVALEAVLVFLNHGPMCPYRHCGPCGCIRSKVVDLLDEVHTAGI